MISGPVIAGKVEESCQAIWQEWLAGYFDGGSHTVSGRAEVFPLIDAVRFTASAALALSGTADSGNVLWISVFSDLQRGRLFYSEPETIGVEVLDLDQQNIELTTWRLVVQASVARSQTTGPNAGNAEYLCRRTGDLLRGILLDPKASLDLARGGMCHFRLLGDAVLPATHFATREIRLRGDVLYGVMNS